MASDEIETDFMIEKLMFIFHCKDCAADVKMFTDVLSKSYFVFSVRFLNAKQSSQNYANGSFQLQIASFSGAANRTADFPIFHQECLAK